MIYLHSNGPYGDSGVGEEEFWLRLWPESYDGFEYYPGLRNWPVSHAPDKGGRPQRHGLDLRPAQRRPRHAEQRHLRRRGELGVLAILERHAELLRLQLVHARHLRRSRRRRPGPRDLSQQPDRVPQDAIQRR